MILLPQRARRPGLFSRDALLALAAEQGLAVTDRMRRDWVRHGLLPPPEQHGLGQGKGSIAGWSQAQVGLWLALLQLWEQELPFRALYNVPVYGWLYGGEGTGVSLAQVKRAIQTWASSQPHVVPLRKARREAHRQVDKVAHPQATGIQALVREMAQWYAGGTLDPHELAYLLEPVVDPHSQRYTEGVTAARHAAAGLFGVKTARELALTHLVEIKDGLWEWARAQVLVAEAEKQMSVAALEQALARGQLSYRRPAGKGLYLSCVLLLTNLGLGYLYRQQEVPMQWFSPVLRPMEWEAGVRTARLESHREYSPLVLPNGRHPFSYEAITVTFLTQQLPAEAAPVWNDHAPSS